MEVCLKKWGNSFGLRLPKAVLNEIGATNGTKFELDVTENKELTLKPITNEMSLEELFADFDLNKYYKEHPIKEIDWGKPVGNEFEW